MSDFLPSKEWSLQASWLNSTILDSPPAKRTNSTIRSSNLRDARRAGPVHTKLCIDQTLARPSLNSANSLKTTISRPKERARQAQKMAILCAGVRGRGDEGREEARRVFFRGAKHSRKGFSEAPRSAARTRTKTSVCARIVWVLLCVPDQHLRLAHLPFVLLHDQRSLSLPIIAVDDASGGLHEGLVKLELLRGPGRAAMQCAQGVAKATRVGA